MSAAAILDGAPFAAPEPVFGFLTPEGDEVLAGSAVVQGLLAASGAATFGELVDALESGDPAALAFADGHRLTPRQIALVDRHLDVYRELPPRSVATLRRCPACGAYALLPGEGSTRCEATAGCAGRTLVAPCVWRAPWLQVRALEG